MGDGDCVSGNCIPRGPDELTCGPGIDGAACDASDPCYSEVCGPGGTCVPPACAAAGCTVGSACGADADCKHDVCYFGKDDGYAAECVLGI